MVRWLRWHCPPDTGFEILAVWGRAHYLSVTEAPHNTDFYTWMGKKHFCFSQTAETGNPPRTLAWKAAVLTTTQGHPPSIKNTSWVPWFLNLDTESWALRRWPNICYNIGSMCRVCLEAGHDHKTHVHACGPTIPSIGHNMTSEPNVILMVVRRLPYDAGPTI